MTGAMQSSNDVHHKEQGATRGQIIVLFAFFSVAMLGMLGLAMDLGMAFAQKRTVQNAADAAALAGARQVAKWSPTNLSPDVAGEARRFAEESPNKIATTDQRMVQCDLVNYNVASDGSGGTLGPCGVGVPPTATGVRVRVEETHSTFFIQVLPGAPNSVTTEAVAVAHVQRFVGSTDGPFIVCGEETMLASGGTMSILLPGGQINPSAYDKTFRVWGPQVATCGVPGLTLNDFKGLADYGNGSRSNANKQVGERWNGISGTRTGPTRAEIDGVGGCQAGVDQGALNGCVAILPIAVSTPAPTKDGHDLTYYVAQLAAFRLQPCGNNCMQGTLLDDYIVSGSGTNTWCRDCGGIIVVRMTT